MSLFMYNIDTNLSDLFMMFVFPSCVYLHVIIHPRHFPDTHGIPKWCHHRISTMFLCCDSIHNGSSDHYPYLYLEKSWLRSEYKPLHDYYLKMTWNIVTEGHFCFNYATFTGIVVIFYYLKYYYFLHWLINFLLIILKVGPIDSTINYWEVFTYYITKLCFSSKLSNNFFKFIQFWAKCVNLSWLMDVCLFSNDVRSNDIKKHFSYNIFGGLFWWKERHVNVSVSFNIR